MTAKKEKGKAWKMVGRAAKMAGYSSINQNKNRKLSWRYQIPKAEDV